MLFLFFDSRFGHEAAADTDSSILFYTFYFLLLLGENKLSGLGLFALWSNPNLQRL